MIKVRRAMERGTTETWWLMSYHSFSFNNYYDTQNMGWSDLRVINEDFVKPSAGFGTHSHRDMEIITYILAGALEHKDSMGNTSIIRPGEVQRMTAGTGVSHSEYNPSDTEPVHLLQIWILPERRGLEPGYEQKSFPEDERRGRLRLVASREGTDGSVKIHQDAKLFVASLNAGQEVSRQLDEGRKAWLQVARGSVNLNGETLSQGDGAAISDEETLKVAAQDEAEILLFDLAA